jgi:hypothetical protein
MCRAEEALSLMDGGSQSPRETSVRLALIDAGFPSPTYPGTTAMGYAAPMVGIEFGARTSELLMQAGWTMISAVSVRNPKIIAYLVRAAVIERGYPLSRLRKFSGG